MQQLPQGADRPKSYFGLIDARSDISAALAAARTFLFVPADDERKRTKAWAAGADAVILDLEDAVAPAMKASARAQLAAALAPRPENGPLVVIRVNGLGTPDGALDLEALRDLPAVAVLVPKADVATLAIAEPARPVIALVETATAVLRAEEIARAPGVERLMFGPVDLAGDLSCEPGATGEELLLARSQVVLASAAAGLVSPIDGPSLAISDPATLKAETDRARRLGFSAKACIHPAQIALVAETLAPAPERIEWARRIVEAYERALDEGAGVVAVDGEMVDVPVARRAYAVLQQSDTGDHQ